MVEVVAEAKCLLLETEDLMASLATREDAAKTQNCLKGSPPNLQSSQSVPT